MKFSYFFFPLWPASLWSWPFEASVFIFTDLNYIMEMFYSEPEPGLCANVFFLTFDQDIQRFL